MDMYHTIKQHEKRIAALETGDAGEYQEDQLEEQSSMTVNLQDLFERVNRISQRLDEIAEKVASVVTGMGAPPIEEAPGFEVETAYRPAGDEEE